jgi:predicted transcriptional regulator
MCDVSRRGSKQPSAAEVSAYVERLAGVLAAGGIPPMPARVFAAMLCTDDGKTTAAELADRLQVSAAAVSGAVRYLLQVGLIARQREVGGRRDVYRLYSDEWYEALSNRDQLLRNWGATFDEGARLFGPRSPTGARLAETTQFMEFVQDELQGLLERWRNRELPN